MAMAHVSNRKCFKIFDNSHHSTQSKPSNQIVSCSVWQIVLNKIFHIFYFIFHFILVLQLNAAEFAHHTSYKSHCAFCINIYFMRIGCGHIKFGLNLF